MLRACFRGEPLAPSWKMAAGQPSLRARVALAAIGTPWAAGMGLYFRGEPDEADRWFAESAALAPASAQWLAGEASLAYRSWIAGERGRLEQQRALAETAGAGFAA